MFDWNDLRYLLAVAREGGTLAAARTLGVDASTVQRRLRALEQALGRPVVTRAAGGYRLTEFGAGLLPNAERVEQSVLELAQGAGALRREAAGVIRVTCPEPLVDRLTHSALLERFHATHPKLHVEFVMSDRYLDLARGDADIALRSGDTDDEQLVGRKVGDSFWAVYASPAYMEKAGAPATADEFARHPWIGLDESMAEHRAARWLREVLPDARIVARNNSVLGLLLSAKAGLGLAALPTALGDAEPALRRVFGPVPELTRAWRLLTLPALRRTPRVAAFFDFMIAEVDALRPIITG